jgi:hypothetical protein
MTGRVQSAAASAGQLARLGARGLPALPVAGAVLALALTTLGLAGCGTAQKAELDREVDRLCAIDGGVHIYETVALPKDYFGPDGELASPYKGRMGKDARYGPDYQSTLTKAYLVSGNTSLTRTAWRLVRKADGKVLGEAIIYSRP